MLSGPFFWVSSSAAFLAMPFYVTLADHQALSLQWRCPLHSLRSRVDHAGGPNDLALSGSQGMAIKPALNERKMKMSTKTNNKPVAKVQVGTVQIAIWKHESEKGPYYKAGAPTLSYRDDNGNWKIAKSYGDRELIHLTKAALMAHSKIAELKRKDRADGIAEQSEEGYDE